MVKVATPQVADQIPAIEDAIEQQLGLSIRNDILARLGPKLSFYIESPAGSVANPMIGDAHHVHRGHVLVRGA